MRLFLGVLPEVIKIKKKTGGRERPLLPSSAHPPFPERKGKRERREKRLELS
jgi:hypothetical protein